jgi:hypothetical protein
VEMPLFHAIEAIKPVLPGYQAGSPLFVFAPGSDAVSAFGSKLGKCAGNGFSSLSFRK